jgi:hypothetical protein
MSRSTIFTKEMTMSDEENPQAQRSQSDSNSRQDNSRNTQDRVGNNMRKDEPTAQQKSSGGMQDEPTNRNSRSNADEANNMSSQNSKSLND